MKAKAEKPKRRSLVVRIGGKAIVKQTMPAERAERIAAIVSDCLRKLESAATATVE